MDFLVIPIRFEADAPTPEALAARITEITTRPVTIQFIEGERTHRGDRVILQDIIIAYEAVPEFNIRIAGFCADQPGRARYASTDSHFDSIDPDDNESPKISDAENSLGLYFHCRDETLLWATRKALLDLGAIPESDIIESYAPAVIAPITEAELSKHWRRARLARRVHYVLLALISPLLIAWVLAQVVLMISICVISFIPMFIISIPFGIWFERKEKTRERFLNAKPPLPQPEP